MLPSHREHEFSMKNVASLGRENNLQILNAKASELQRLLEPYGGYSLTRIANVEEVVADIAVAAAVKACAALASAGRSPAIRRACGEGEFEAV